MWYFFEENFKAERYLDFWSLDLVPALLCFPNEVDEDIITETFFFQHTRPHFGIMIREYIDDILNQH